MLEFIYDVLEKFEQFILDHSWFAPLSTVLLPFIEALIPSLPLTILIGFNLNMMATIYGATQGTFLTVLLSTLGSFLGMLLIFIIIRVTLAPFFAKRVSENRYGKMFLNAVEGPNVFLILVIMSNPFLPSSILNYALSLTRTSVRRYLFLTITSRLIIIIFLVFLGSIFDIQNHPMNILWLALFYMALFGIWYFFYHHYRKNKPKNPEE
ncbi:MAG: VTT domain-containing protein [Candidatus Izemoplasmatales bacterium]|jgi:uncharacterized membrane protein YdjX (TVP38/TMEM64 family)|nr:VTT domain-containing protein [Candidatus Izemoplasmatales bacterium]MDD5293587.1 VTT domain-containing protein [Candidatus Izemoplasmatales bacterium]